MKRKLILIVLLVVSIAFATYKYLYQEHRDVAASTVDFTIEASALSQAFLNDEKEATMTYLNKIIEVKGRVKDIDGAVLTLESSILIDLKEPLTPPQVEKLKGNAQSFYTKTIFLENSIYFYSYWIIYS